jgi:TRAP-type mannitol/chloroaromatic compound transport system substrate-binding protein
MEYHVVNAKSFAAEVKAATNGELAIHVHAGGVLGIKGPDTMRAIEEGIVDAADMSAFQQVGVEPILGLESLPYLVETFDELRLLYQIIRPEIDAAYARHGQQVLYIVPWPNQNFFIDREIRTVDDLAGVTIRRRGGVAGGGFARRGHDLDHHRLGTEVLGLSEVHVPLQPHVVMRGHGRQPALARCAHVRAARRLGRHRAPARTRILGHRRP